MHNLRSRKIFGPFEWKHVSYYWLYM